MKPSDRLIRLRAATRPLHDRIEAAMGLPAPMQRQHYLRFLTTWWGFLVPLEAKLAELHQTSLDPSFDWAPRLKTAWLEQDLKALGLTPSQVDALPLCPEVPQLQGDWGRAMGCQYVLEGASLGGQLLSRMVREALPEAQAACRFIASYGSDVGAMWRAFLPVLERALAATEASVTAAACETFTTLERWAHAQPRALG